jgi:hypothetical protein
MSPLLLITINQAKGIIKIYNKILINKLIIIVI